MIKRIFLAAFSAASLMTLFSCDKEEMPSSYEEEADGLIAFSPVIAGDDEGTKGTMVTGTQYNLGPFWVKAWDFADNTLHIDDYTKVIQFTHASGSGHTYWSTVDSSDKMLEHIWKKNVEMRFFAYTNLPSASGAAQVTNTDKWQQYLQYDVTKVPDASSQKDILLGFYTGKGLTPAAAGKTGDGWVGRFAKIEFYHPLAAIRFKMGTIEGWTTGDKITGIQIVGAYASGKFKAKSRTSSDSKWNTLSGSTTVSMSDASGLAIASDDFIGETFFLIPQDIATQNITVKVSFTAGGTAYTKNCALSAGTWTQGYIHTYTLDFEDSEICLGELEVTPWTEKTGATVENTGTVTI